jgi:hypothetical protein
MTNQSKHRWKCGISSGEVVVSCKTIKDGWGWSGAPTISVSGGCRNPPIMIAERRRALVICKALNDAGDSVLDRGRVCCSGIGIPLSEIKNLNRTRRIANKFNGKTYIDGKFLHCDFLEWNELDKFKNAIISLGYWQKP